MVHAYGCRCRSFLKLLVLLGLIFFGANAAYAQTSSSASEPVLVATVNIYGAKITSEVNGTFAVSFELSNRTGAQPGVKYAVELLDSKQNVVDQMVYPAALNLDANTTIPLTIEYTAPSYLSGTYQMVILSSNTNGLPLAEASLGSVKLSGSGAHVAIQPSACYLQISGAVGKYSLDQGIDIASSESLSLVCAVQNNSPSALTLVPSFETFYRNAFGSQVQAQAPTEPAISIAAGATQNVTVALPKPSEPQAYDVQVSFTNAQNVPSNSVIVHFVLDGPSATIQNVTLDKTSYNAGDSAQVTLFWTGIASNFPGARNATTTQLQGTQATVSIVNGSGSSCGQSVSAPLDTMEPQQVIPFPITAACDSPTVSVTLGDSSGTLASSSFNFAGPASTSSSSQQQGTSNDTWLVIIGLAILFIGGYVVLRWHKPKLPDSTATMIIFLILGSALAAGTLPQQAKADTYTQNVYVVSSGGWQGWFNLDFTANLDNDTYAPGAPITASGNASVGACGNSLYADEEATINGQTQQVTSNYTVWGGNDYLWETQPSPSTFTAPTVPGSYQAAFNYELAVAPSGPGSGSSFCEPDITSSCQTVRSFTATNPYLIPYAVTASSPGTCPDGSAAPGGNSTECSCQQGNQSACNPNNCPQGQFDQAGTCVASCSPGYTQSGTSCVPDTCPQGQFDQAGTCVASCSPGYTQEGNMCVPSGVCPVGYGMQGGQCTFSNCPQGYQQNTDSNGNPACAYTGVCSAGPVCYQGNAYTENASCGLSSEQVCNWGCSNGQCLVPPPPSIATWQIKPMLVQSDGTTAISWQAANVSSCTVTGTNGDGTSGSTDTNSPGVWNTESGTKTSSPITGQTIYTILCQGYPGASPASATQSATVNLVPSFQEQ